MMDEDLREAHHDEMMLWLDANAEDIVNQMIYPGFDEQQIKTFSKHPADIKKLWQQPIKSPTNEIISFIDMIVSYERSGDPDDDISKVFFFDVRTAIPSLGAMIREINMRKEYLGFAQSWINTYILVCPDNRYTNILKEQEIELLHYAPDAS